MGAMTSRRRRALRSAAPGILALVAAALVLAHVPILRVVGGLALLLFLPGLAITMAAAPGRALEGVGRLACALGCSTALTAIAAVGLDLAGARITEAGWTVVVTAVAVLAAAVATVRDAQGSGLVAPPVRFVVARLRLSVALGVVAILIATGSVALAAHSARHDVRRGFTELSIVARSLDGGSGAMVTVTSRERAGRAMTLAVSQGKTILVRSTVTLVPGETRRWTVPIRTASVSGPVEAELYQLGRRAPYRAVALWP